MQRRYVTVDVFTDHAFGGNLAGERDAEKSLRIGQGVDLGRPSLLRTRVRKENGVVVSSHVGGRCVPMIEGTFRLEGEE